jgi:hypothetical protein
MNNHSSYHKNTSTHQVFTISISEMNASLTRMDMGVCFFVRTCVARAWQYVCILYVYRSQYAWCKAKESIVRICTQAVQINNHKLYGIKNTRTHQKVCSRAVCLQLCMRIKQGVYPICVCYKYSVNAHIKFSQCAFLKRHVTKGEFLLHTCVCDSVCLQCLTLHEYLCILLYVINIVYLNMLGAEGV